MLKVILTPQWLGGFFCGLGIGVLIMSVIK